MNLHVNNVQNRMYALQEKTVQNPIAIIAVKNAVDF